MKTRKKVFITIIIIALMWTCESCTRLSVYEGTTRMYVLEKKATKLNHHGKYNYLLEDREGLLVEMITSDEYVIGESVFISTMFSK